jgi:hypothetical protein
VQLLANLVEGSVPDVAASGAATGIETGQHAVLVRRSRVGRSKPANATPSAATAFSACRPEDAKSYPNKMFELSGFRDAITAGNWRHRNLLGTLCIRRSLVGVGAPRRTSGCWRRHEGPLFHWPISSFTQGRADYLPRKLATNRDGRKAQRTPPRGLRRRGLPATEILAKPRTRRLAKYAKYYSKLLVVFHVQMPWQSIIMGSKREDISVEDNL